MKTYPNVRRALAGKLWFVHEPKIQEMLLFFEIKLAGGATSPEVLKSIRATNQAAVARAQSTAASAPRSIVVIPIYGLLTHRGLSDISGGSIGTSTQQISETLRRAVADPSVGQIVLDVDSPGGDVEGVDELASKIYQARKQKPIIAVSNCLCASAAYYLASQASEIIASPSSLTGSIGVYTLHEDDSAMLENAGVKLELIKYGENKAEGNNLGPLTDSARAHMQEMVDTYGKAFERAVARGRGITQGMVHSKFGQGRVFDAAQAVRIGMVDRVGTFDDALSTSAQRSIAARRQAQFAATPAAKKARARALELARMRHELLMAGGNPSPIKRDVKRAGDGDADDCGCDCVPCDGGDCDNCDCDACECEGCACDSAVAKAKAKKARALEFARMRREINVARLT